MRIHQLIVIAGLGAALAAPTHAQTAAKADASGHHVAQTGTKADTGGHHFLRTAGNAVKKAASATAHATHRAFTKTVEFTKDRFGRTKPAKRVASDSGKTAHPASKGGTRVASKAGHVTKGGKANVHNSPHPAGKNAKDTTKA